MTEHNSLSGRILTMVLVFTIGSSVLLASEKPVTGEIVVPDKASDIHPILIGQPLPKIVLKNPGNSDFDLNAAVMKKPTVLVYFRGGW